ncbi:hypothetical protein VaNZ11_008507, partial [Volvox africanus]
DMVLHFPDYSLLFRVELISDASLQGSGAVLVQSGRPIAFTSKKFSLAERGYTTAAGKITFASSISGNNIRHFGPQRAADASTSAAWVDISRSADFDNAPFYRTW